MTAIEVSVKAHCCSGMTTSLDMYNNKKIDDNYTYPGGPLWNGETLVVDKPDLTVVNVTSS